MEEASDVKLDIKSRVTTLIGHVFEDGFSYAEELEDVYDSDTHSLSRRVTLDGARVAECDRLLWRSLLGNPILALPACEEALREAFSNVDRYPEIAKLIETAPPIRVGLKGHFGPYMVSPRLLSCLRVNKTVCLIGIVTRATTVRPKVTRSVHYCQATKEYMSREYRDVTSNSGAPTTTFYPSRDEAGNLLETEYGYCTYVNSHTVSMQELPELSPPGMLPRSVEIILEDDLADACKPGDRVYVTGILKPVISRNQAQVKSHMKTVVVANSVTATSADVSCSVSREDLRQIKQIASSAAPLDVLASSFAPTIYGHEIIKKGILLLMMGGAEKTLATKTHLRGDINCLLVGDPGTAKSQLLRAVMEVCPLSISTTGRGSTGVGLTAAVTTDLDTGEKRLEAGAMVLADRGIVCIDEFDKMSDIDRVAIHEVMEQQTVTITKSGVKASLNARCSVMAAANPLYGNYDHNISIAKNVNLPDSLLSRFDLLFIVLDEKDREHDNRISQFVLDRHVEQSGDASAQVMHTVHSWHFRHSSEQYDASANNLTGNQAQEGDTLPPEFLRKYIFYAKQHMSGKIQLTEEAMKVISEYYVELRSSSTDRALPITPRTLETIIRLSTAHAKLRLSPLVEKVDVEEAKVIANIVLGTQGIDTTNGSDADPRPPLRAVTQEENMDVNTEIDAPTIRSYIPAKESSAKPSSGDAMEGVVVQSMEALTDSHKQIVHNAIGSVLEGKPFSTVSDVSDILKRQGLNLSDDCLMHYLQWIAESYESMPHLHLPQILFDPESREFYDVS